MREFDHYPKEFIVLIKSITNKRAKIVIDHIMEHGFITTEDLEGYGYKHAPRAARDVRENGIPLITYNVKSKEGKSIAAYKFGDLSQLQANKKGGRIQFPKEFKSILYKTCGGRCSICHTPYEERYLQVDHKVPYEIGGDAGIERKTEDYMLLCGSCNRAKSWSCEHCENWSNDKKQIVCKNCYWGSPENYYHIALREMRRLDITWTGDSVKNYDAIKVIAEDSEIDLPEFIKDLIDKNINGIA